MPNTESTKISLQLFVILSHVFHDTETNLKMRITYK